MEITNEKSNVLTVSVKSFSYQKGIPYDKNGHGGGFVFDCRALNNPGRIKEFENLTGKDAEVTEFLVNNSHVVAFLDLAEKLVSQSVEKYIQLGYTHLEVNFGCTGGQHRSVYCAETMAKFLKKAFPQINVAVKHLEMEK